MTRRDYKAICMGVASNDVRHALYLEGLVIPSGGVRFQVRDAGTPAS